MADRSSLDLVFAGTPEFAAKHLEALLASPHRLVGVYTQPDRPAGRGRQVTPSPVKRLAQAADLPVFQPASLKNPESQTELAALKPDVMVVVAYGLLLPRAVLDIPRLGCINVHASLLPRWRGAAPIQRAIEAGDRQSGVTIMQMEAGLDTGPMLHKASCDLRPEDTAGSLHDRLAELGPGALLTTLDQLARGAVSAEVQENRLATYAHKIDKAEAQLDWRLPAQTLDRKLRAFSPFPGAYTSIAGERIRLLQAVAEEAVVAQAPGTVLQLDAQGVSVQCGEGVLRITRLQLAGKKPVSAAEFANGSSRHLRPGQVLDLPSHGA